MIDWNDYWYFAPDCRRKATAGRQYVRKVSKSVLSRRMSALSTTWCTSDSADNPTPALTKSASNLRRRCQTLVNQSERAALLFRRYRSITGDVLRGSVRRYSWRNVAGAAPSTNLCPLAAGKCAAPCCQSPGGYDCEGIDIALSVSSGALPDSSLHYKKSIRYTIFWFASPSGSSNILI